jgi:hypothetical protein
MLANRHGRRVRVGLLSLVLVVLLGCGSEPRGCADEKTVSLVKEMFWDAVGKNASDANDKALLSSIRPKFDVTLQLPRLTEKKGDAAKVFCAGTLRVSLGEAASNSVPKMFKRENVVEVEYSSQLTADGKQHVVELGGQENAVEYVWSLAKMGAFNAALATP